MLLAKLIDFTHGCTDLALKMCGYLYNYISIIKNKVLN